MALQWPVMYACDGQTLNLKFGAKIWTENLKIWAKNGQKGPKMSLDEGNSVLEKKLGKCKFWRQFFREFFLTSPQMSGKIAKNCKKLAPKMRNFLKIVKNGQKLQFLGQSGHVWAGNGQKWRKNGEKLARKLEKIVWQMGQFGLEFGAFWGHFLGIFGIFGVNVHFWAGGHGLGPKELQKLQKFAQFGTKFGLCKYLCSTAKAKKSNQKQSKAI